MSTHIQILDNDFFIPADKVNHALGAAQDAFRTPFESLEQAGEEVSVELTTDDDGNINGIDLTDSYESSRLLLFFASIAPFVKDKSFVNVCRTDEMDLWQWYFDGSRIHTRFIKLVGLPTGKEQGINPQELIYRFCSQEDCTNVEIMKEGYKCKVCAAEELMTKVSFYTDTCQELFVICGKEKMKIPRYAAWGPKGLQNVVIETSNNLDELRQKYGAHTLYAVGGP